MQQEWAANKKKQEKKKQMPTKIIQAEIFKNLLEKLDVKRKKMKRTNK